ncbi:MAG: hypothetical protein QNJ72_25630 [Pleurocapsa sp. MO_226.B13]|nr:hypothetical protein [Pleurocapsa sp. MO_226.B13]
MANQQTSGFPSDRTKRIREHLAKSSGGEINFQRLPQNYNPENGSATSSSTQKRRMEHLERSKGNYDLNSGSKEARKSRIMSHVRITRG